MKKQILIFPAGMPRALDYSKKCLQEGREVVGSSSLRNDPSREMYSKWVKLPYVTDPAFNDEIQQAIVAFDIGEIYTPNFTVWSYLNQTLGHLAPGVVLVNRSPVDEVLSEYRAALLKARFLIANPLVLTSDVPIRPALSEIEMAALVRYADLIPGMCDDDKLLALVECTRYAVNGDIVEIGSWWGKSAYILTRLSQCLSIGNLLCVDPWANEHLVQNESIVDCASSQVNAEEALTVFQIGLLPLASHKVNYLRMTSVEAAQYYKDSNSVSTEIFGHTEYSGKIAILHIDGNHTYDAAKADVVSWVKFVIEGGWIIIDDYIWSFGDGPQRVGDEFLESHHSMISTAFVMGTALFIQLI
jgi:Methyltransferase domain